MAVSIERRAGVANNPWVDRAIALVIAAIVVVAASVVFGPRPDPAGAALPPNFSQQVIVGGLAQPTAMAWYPGEDRFIVAEQSGVVHLVDGATRTQLLDISGMVNDFNDRGLLGLAVDGDFPTTPRFYALYTYDPPETADFAALWDNNPGPNRARAFGGPDEEGQRVSRLSSFELDPATNYTTVVANSEVVLLGQNSTWDNIADPYSNSDAIDSLWSCVSYQPGDAPEDGTPIDDCIASDALHTIGTVRFAADGTLLVGMGDASSPDHIDPRTIRSLDLDLLTGKILKIDPDTGDGLLSNPFAAGQTTTNRSKVYQYGLRNPFRFTADPVTSQPYIGDVGWNSYEEINIGGPGASFGWPCFEGGLAQATMDAGNTAGPGVQLVAPGYGALPMCAAHVNAPANHTGPTRAWCHDGIHAICTMQDASAYAGVVNNASYYPAAYQGLWIGDIYGDLEVMDLATGDVTLISDDRPFIVDMSMGPDGSVYMVSAFGTVLRLAYDEAPQELCQGLPISVDIGNGDAPTAGDDVIKGTPNADVIDALGGNDVICADGGDDIIDGGPGEDVIEGDAGNDTLRGDGGFDTLIGGPDNDTLEGGGEGDLLVGGAGLDVLDGGEGVDRLEGGADADTLIGGPGDDQLFGGDAADILRGDSLGAVVGGNDFLSGGPGANTLEGGPGIDFLEGGADGESLDGGADNDYVLGHGGNDTLLGGAGIDYLWGGDGVDSFDGGADRDYLDGGPEGETMDGGPGDDLVLGRGGNDTLLGGEDSDYVWGGDGIDSFDGGGGPDYLDGGPEGETMNGGPGDDFVIGHEGNDALFGDGDDDYLWGGPGVDTFDGGTGNDHLESGAEAEVLNGGPGNDILLGFGGNDILNGDGDDDYLWGGTGVDEYFGGAGNDTLEGGDEDEQMNGGANDDFIFGHDGDDDLRGGTGTDECDGGLGDDRFRDCETEIDPD